MEGTRGRRPIGDKSSGHDQSLAAYFGYQHFSTDGRLKLPGVQPCFHGTHDGHPGVGLYGASRVVTEDLAFWACLWGCFCACLDGPPGVNAMAAITMATTAAPTPAVSRPDGTQDGRPPLPGLRP